MRCLSSMMVVLLAFSLANEALGAECRVDTIEFAMRKGRKFHRARFLVLQDGKPIAYAGKAEGPARSFRWHKKPFKFTFDSSKDLEFQIVELVLKRVKKDASEEQRKALAEVRSKFQDSLHKTLNQDHKEELKAVYGAFYNKDWAKKGRLSPSTRLIYKLEAGKFKSGVHFSEPNKGRWLLEMKGEGVKAGALPVPKQVSLKIDEIQVNTRTGGGEAWDFAFGGSSRPDIRVEVWGAERFKDGLEYYHRGSFPTVDNRFKAGWVKPREFWESVNGQFILQVKDVDISFHDWIGQITIKHKGKKVTIVEQKGQIVKVEFGD